jgi:hypothetical protein
MFFMVGRSQGKRLLLIQCRQRYIKSQGQKLETAFSLLIKLLDMKFYSQQNKIEKYEPGFSCV